MVESDEQPERDSGGGAAMAALHQCELIQNMIDISISSLQGLRTKCAASNDLTQQEIRTLEVKLMKYICKQLQCKQKVPETERPEALDSYPHLRDWLRTINLRPELIEAVEAKLSLDALLQMTGAQVRDTMRRLGSSSEECARLSAALSCLNSATESGGELREDGSPWLSEPTRRDSGSLLTADQLTNLGTPLRPHSPSPLARPSAVQSTPSTPCAAFPHPRSGSVSAVPTPEAQMSYIHSESPPYRSIPHVRSSCSSAPRTHFHPTYNSALKEASPTEAPLHPSTSVPQSAASTSQHHPDTQQKPRVPAGQPHRRPTHQQMY